MHLVFRTLKGARREALVLAVGENRLRIVVAGQRDAVELRRTYGHWTSDLGATVQLEGIMAHDGIDLARFYADLFPREQALSGVWLPV
ncbi:MAG TPA: hypothetical protein VGF59_07235 [Bryobacteraceae bacterium]|jgi:hypothetical protein